MTNNNPYPVSIGNLYDPRVVYKMPLYQREYCWKPEKELTDFKEDFVRIFESLTSNNPENVFLGAVVLQSGGANYSATQSREFTVIDGQQRITTIYLTIAALSQYAYEKGWVNSADIIISDNLISKGVSNRNQPILEPTNQDTNQFYEIISQIKSGSNKFEIPTNGSGEKSGQMTKAYDFIRKEIVEVLMEDMGGSKNSFDQLVTCFLDNFVIADINLDSQQHNPNEVFDRLNQRGQKLGVIDLIRNDCFRNFSQNKTNGDAFYQNNWKPFEDKLKTKFSDIVSNEKKINDQVDNFFYPFAINKKNDIRKQQLLKSLDENWGATSPTKKVQEMQEYIDPYFTWLEGNDVKQRIDQSFPPALTSSIINLKQLKAPRACLPFLMRCLVEVKKNNLSANNASECFNILESFFVRRTMVFEEEGTGYDQIFKKLWEECKGDPTKLKDKMPSRTKTFPDDTQFYNGLLKTPLYGKKIDRYMVLQYEKHLAKQAFEVYPNQAIETLDHINPQTIKGLNQKQKEEHSRTLHLWGNLLPMSRKLNSSKSNRKLKDCKKELKLYSKFETTNEFISFFAGKPHWEPKWIDQRTSNLAKWALTRWKSI